ncbi:MAG: hypothetical protein HYV60_19910 [Planctomycetia bacterium]|nr:hypothetical protein [Planctomycetia bacterium]
MSHEIDTLIDQYDRGVINRRQLLTALTAGMALPAMTYGQRPESKAPAFEARSLNHVTLSVSDGASANQSLLRRS